MTKREKLQTRHQSKRKHLDILLDKVERGLTIIEERLQTIEAKHARNKKNAPSPSRV